MKRRLHLGFTLIELLTTIAIMGVIAAMAAPSFQRQIARSQIKDDVHKVENCFKDNQVNAYLYQTDYTVTINTTTNEISCSTGTPPTATTIKLKSQIKSLEEVGSNPSIVFSKNRSVTATPRRNITNADGTSDNSANYSFCITGAKQNTLQLQPNGLINVQEGSTTCN